MLGGTPVGVHAGALRSVELHHRGAAEVAERMRALAEPGEAVVAQGQVLILKADPARLDELDALARSLDRPLERLRIRVRQAQTRQREARGVGVAANVGSGVRVVTPGGAPPDTVHVYGTARSAARTREATQFVSAVEGRSAHLAVGVQLPVTGSVRYGPTGVRETVEYVDVSTGFDVIAQVHGDDVTLDIAPRDATPGAGGAVAFSAAQTTVGGPLGTWIPLAGSVIDAGADRRGGLARSTRRGRQEIAIEVMVERW